MRISLVFFFLCIHVNSQAQLSDFDEVDFRRADSIAAFYQGADLSSLAILSYQLSRDLSTDVEKFRAIYTWVCNNISNDYWYYLKNKKQRQKLRKDSVALASWNATLLTLMYKRLLEEQEAVCTGYAYLLKEMAFFAGIDCVIIDGYGRNVNANIEELSLPNHSWNAVKLDDKWYLCDATWSSGSILIQKDNTTFIKDFNDGYFLAEPELFVKNHYPLDTTWILMDRKPTLDEFIQAPLVYTQAFSHHIIPYNVTSMKMDVLKNDSVFFYYKTAEVIPNDSIYLQVKSSGWSQMLKPTIIQNSDGVLVLMVSFSKRGIYDVHLLIDEEPIVTYTFSITKNKG